VRRSYKCRHLLILIKMHSIYMEGCTSGMCKHPLGWLSSIRSSLMDYMETVPDFIAIGSVFYHWV